MISLTLSNKVKLIKVKNNKTIEALTNAGFKEILDNSKEVKMDCNNIRIYVTNSSPFDTRVYILGEDARDAKLIPSQQGIKDLEELNKALYAYTGKDLQWEKRYLWEDCYVGKGYHINSNSKVQEIADEFPSSHDTSKDTAITKEDAMSMLAFAQLTHIVAKINEDYPADSKYRYGHSIVFRNGELGTYSIKESFGPILFTLSSEEGANKLIETNTPLLKQWLKIK